MSLYKRDESEFWWCQFRVAGKLVRLSTGKTDRRDASKEERRLWAEAEKARGSLAPSPSTPAHGRTLAILASADIARAETDRTTPEHQHVLSLRWIRVLDLLGHDIAPEAITADTLKKYIDERQAQGLRNQTIRRELCDIRRALLEGVERGWIVKLPKWPKLKDDSKDPAQAGKLHSDDAVRAVFSCVPQDVREACAFAYATGLRFSELKRVNIEWMTRPTFEAKVPWILTLPAPATKSRKERVVGISEEIAQLLARRAAEHGPIVFPRSGYRKALKRACDAVGYSKTITLRDLRHMFATKALKESQDIQAVSDALGHSALSTTVLYLHADDASVANLAAGNGQKAITATRSQETPITVSKPQALEKIAENGAGDGIRTRDPELGKLGKTRQRKANPSFPDVSSLSKPNESNRDDHRKRSQADFDHRSTGLPEPLTPGEMSRAIALATAATRLEVLEGWISAKCSGCLRTVEVFKDRVNGSACVCPVCQNQLNTEGAVYVG